MAMAKLSAGERAALPDGAFAYADSRGSRKLPIHDEPHVRNAMARFNQVRFETDEARARAVQKLLEVAIGSTTQRTSVARQLDVKPKFPDEDRSGTLAIQS